MAKSPLRLAPRRTTANFAKLQRDLTACSDRVDELERAIEINIKRMAAMQAEIDHLRAQRH